MIEDVLTEYLHELFENAELVFYRQNDLGYIIQYVQKVMVQYGGDFPTELESGAYIQVKTIDVIRILRTMKIKSILC